MANDVNANINIGVDSTQALASLRSLQSQISTFNKSVIASNASAIAAQKGAVAGLAAQIGATKQFSTSIVNVESSVSRLGRSIDSNRLSLGQYFRYGIASSKTFGSVFKKEHIEMTAVASSRVKALQTQYIALAASQNGLTKSMAVRPLNLFNASTAIATQRQMLFGKMLRDGSTSLVNFGKNTQWAGRQLMVGFTVPLTIFGGIAGKIFMDLEKQIVNFRRVYGDATTPLEETNGMIEQIKELGSEFTKYGIAVKDTMKLAGDAAAAGASGDDLVAQTVGATRLSTLGMIDQQQALTATIALQSAFKLSSDELNESVNFLNAVENQTVLSLDDVTVAIPKVATIIKGLGGDVQDLSVFLAAMREGGVNAAEGANALKSGLASLINPTKGARDQLEAVGINIDSIINANKGDIRGMVMSFGEALGTLDKFSKQQTLAKVFGKFQFARLGALFENINEDGSQAQRVIDLTGQSVEQLAELADKELGAIEDSIGVKFTGALERLKLAIAPIGEMFLRIATPIIEVVTRLLSKFDDLSPGVKTFITVLVAGVGIVVPSVIMLIGLFANFIGQAIKGAAMFNNFFNRIRGGGSDLKYLSSAELDAAAAAASLEGKTTSLTNALNLQKTSVMNLSRAYQNYAASAMSTAAIIPRGFAGGTAGAAPRRMATGGVVGGTGNRDTEPALLTPGEFVINAESSKKFGPLLTSINEGDVGMFNEGKTSGKKLFSVGGQSIPLNVSGSTELAINRRISEAASLGESALEALARELMKLVNEVSLLTPQVDSALRAAPELSGMRSIKDKNYSAPEFIRKQTAGLGWESKSKEIEAIQSRVAQKWNQYGGATEKQLGNMASVQASHLTKMEDSFGGKIWSPKNLTPDLGAINNYLNRVESMTLDTANGSEVMSELVKATGMEYQEVLSEVQRLQQGIHPQTRESFEVLDALAGLDEQYSLQEIQAREQTGLSQKRTGQMKNALGVNAASGSQASAALATTQVRLADNSSSSYINTMKQRAYREAEDVTQGAVDGGRSGQGSNSPSKKMKVVGEEFVDGWVSGVAGSKGEAVRASQAMSESAVQAARSGQLSILDINNSPVQGELFSTSGMQGSGDGFVPNVNGPRQGDQGRIHNIEQAHGAAIEQNTKNVLKSSVAAESLGKEQSKLRGVSSKFGKTLTSGGLKVNGAMGAVSGMAFAASMMGGGMGEFAQKIMPAVFGLQGLIMALPMLMNPIALAAVAIAAVGVGFWMLDNNRKNLQEKIIKSSIAMDGSSKAFDELSKELGGMKPSEKFSAISSGMSGEKKQKALSEGQTFLESESGKSMTERAKLLSGKERKNAIEREIIQSLAFDIISPEQAEGVARAMGLALKDPILGVSLVSGINSYLSGSSPEITKGIEGVTNSIIEDAARAIKAADDLSAKELELKNLNIKKSQADSGGFSYSDSSFDKEGDVVIFTDEDKKRMEEIQKEFATTGDAVTASIGPMIDNSRKLAEAQAYLNLQWRSGSIDAAGYTEATDSIQLGQAALAATFSELQKGTSDSSFSENLKMASLAIGMTAEDFSRMEDQARGLEEVLKTTFGKDNEWAESASNSLQFALTSGAIDSATAGTLPKLLENKQYENIVNLSLEGDDPALLANVVKSLNQIEMLPEPIKTQVSSEFLSGDFDTPAEFNSWIQKTLTMASYFAKSPKLQMEAYVSLNEGSITTEEITKLEKFFNSIEKNSKISAIVDIDTVGIKSLDEANTQWDELGKKKEISKVIKMNDEFSSVADKFKAQMSILDGIPDIFKKAVLLQMNVVANAEINLGSAQDSLAAVPEFGDGPSSAGYLANINKEQDRIKKAMDSIQSLVTEGTKATVEDPPGDDGSGGSPAKSFFQQLLDDTKADLALFPKMLNKLKGKGIPEQIIDMIGGGEEGLKKAKELLNVSKKQLKDLITSFNKNLVNQAIKASRVEKNRKKQKNQAIDILMARGMSSEDAVDFASDAGRVQGLLAAELDKTGKATEKVVGAYESMKDVPEYLDPIEKKLKDIDDVYKASMLPLQGKIDKQQDIVDAIQEELDALKKINDTDQKKTRSLERQKEMIQRQIEDHERINELDQRKIDTLQRQDELRNREASAMDHELEVLSDMEKKIRETYAERIDALEKVSSLNNNIVQQQKDQLGVSQALAEGDIYAAATAVQQMRQNQVQAAQQQTRDALNQSMENSVDSLKTSGGLTRDEAEERIKQIKEQSYQTSLLIRDVEDKIFSNNLLLIPLKDQLLLRDREIRNIADVIYDRETQILKIEESKLEPAAKLLESYSEQAQEKKKQLDIDSGLIDGANLLSEMTDDQIERAGLLGSAWYEVGKQIDQAMKLAARQKVELNNVKPMDKTKKNYDSKIAQHNLKVERINKRLDSTVDAILGSGQDALNKNMGGRIMNKVAGSIPGSGGRDSISAMLTPGEFVVRKSMVEKYGAPMLKAINQGSFVMPKYSSGPDTPSISSKGGASTSINAPVYNNFSVSVSATTNANADDIANKAVMKIKQMQNMQVRSSRG